jgi:hypothetical protein
VEVPAQDVPHTPGEVLGADGLPVPADPEAVARHLCAVEGLVGDEQVDAWPDGGARTQGPARGVARVRDERERDPGHDASPGLVDDVQLGVGEPTSDPASVVVAGDDDDGDPTGDLAQQHARAVDGGPRWAGAVEHVARVDDEVDLAPQGRRERLGHGVVVVVGAGPAAGSAEDVAAHAEVGVGQVEQSHAAGIAVGRARN